MLSCTDLSFSYQGTERLKSVTFTVEPGALLALFGHNGSGKSTLLKMLGGSLPIRRGHVHVMGDAAIGKNGYLRRDLRGRFGILFQAPSSDEKLSVLDNLIFSARIYGLSKDEAHTRALWALECASLGERANDPVKKLSGGMRRRLELYRCFLHKPKVILLDEPTAGLDVGEVAKFFAFLKRYREDHKAAVVMASHHADELHFADRVAMMKDGSITELGSPNAMLGRLDYLRCSFVLDGIDALTLQNLNLYDHIHQDDGKIQAKIKTFHLDNFLRNSILRDASIKSFSIERPSLADVYQDSHETRL